MVPTGMRRPRHQAALVQLDHALQAWACSNLEEKGKKNVDRCRGTQLRAAGMQVRPRLRICRCAAHKLRVSPLRLTHSKAAVGLTVRLKVRT